MTDLLLATRNPGKLVELRRMLDAARIAGIRVLGLADLPPFPEEPETGATFAENALAKARDAAKATGLASVADDSGLAVDALNGMPGVLSARWSGTLSSHGGKDDATNNRLLLDQLADVPDERRGAQFRCAVAFCHPDQNGGVAEVVVHGVMPGRVIREQRGTSGFGYDVLFVPDDQVGELTSAEMTAEAKDAISHRGRALREIAPVVVAVLAGR
jgi:XTP/dITP diphosphohydrolase